MSARHHWWRWLLVTIGCASSATVTAAEVLDLVRSPAARAARLLESGDTAAALRVAPDAEWAGLAHLEAGDADAALQAFDARLLEVDDPAVRARLEYNRALAATRADRLDEAIDGFDRVLEVRPDDVDARHNRDLAERLRAMSEEQQPGEQDGEQEGEQGSEQNGEPGSNQGDQQDGEQDGEQGGEQEGGQGSEQKGEQGEEQSGDAADDPSGAGSDENAASDPLDAQQREAAREMLDAQTSSEQAGNPDEAIDQRDAATDAGEVPLSESEQALEQWLRRIPDDPSGLLRRKLEQTHRANYPEVRDAEQDW